LRSDPSKYDLFAPNKLEKVLDLLKSEPGVWTPFAGGTEWMVQFGAGSLVPRRFVNVWNLPELRRIDVTGDYVSIGAGCTFSDIRYSGTVGRYFPLLSIAACTIGGFANQNRATIGGNIVNGSPAADSPPALLAYGAEIELASSNGIRRIPYSEFHLEYKKVDLKAEALVYAVRLPLQYSSNRQYLRKVGPRNAQAISKVALAAVGELAFGQVKRVRIAAASLAPVPLRCLKTEQYLLGKPLDRESILKAKAILMAEASPIDDLRSTAKYRSQVAANLLEEFLLDLRDDR
jgi:CO/xanthine dehydrogenase FAD-binding subunit